MVTYKYIGFQTLCDKIRKNQQKLKAFISIWDLLIFVETENLLLKIL